MKIHEYVGIGDPRDMEAEIELLSSDAVAVRPGDEVWLDHRTDIVSLIPAGRKILKNSCDM